MYDMAQKTRQEDAGAGRSSNRADKPVSIAVAIIGIFCPLAPFTDTGAQLKGAYDRAPIPHPAWSL